MEDNKNLDNNGLAEAFKRLVDMQERGELISDRASTHTLDDGVDFLKTLYPPLDDPKGKQMQDDSINSLAGHAGVQLNSDDDRANYIQDLLQEIELNGFSNLGMDFIDFLLPTNDDVYRGLPDTTDDFDSTFDFWGQVQELELEVLEVSASAHLGAMSGDINNQQALEHDRSIEGVKQDHRDGESKPQSFEM